MNIYGIRDKVANAMIGTLWLIAHDAPAIRIFSDIASDPASMIAKHPEDFVLLRLGVIHYDDDAKIEPTIHADTDIVLDGAAWAAAQQPRRAE